MIVEILSFILLSLFLQEINAQSLDRNPVRFGIRAGINFSHMNFSRGAVSSEVAEETNFAPGATVGLLMIIPLMKPFYLQPEYSYTGTGGELKNSGTKYKFHYLTLPLFLRWEVSDNLAFIGGPQFELLIDAKQVLDGDAISIIHETEERSISSGFGAEYQFKKSYWVALRYFHGFNNINISKNASINEFKYENIQFAFVYIF